MKKYTAIQQAIFDIEKEFKEMGMENHPTTNAVIRGLKTYLPLSRQEIIEAYTNGVDDEYEYHINGEPRLSDPSEYFEQTYLEAL